MIAIADDPQTAQFRTDVLNGLLRSPKTLPAKYFYDAKGSKLFDEITGLDEYYLTRVELDILRKHAAAIAAKCGPRCLLIEPGAGSAVKARLLLDRLDRPAGYVPVDVSGDHLHATAAKLFVDYPTLKVFPVVADFTREIPLPAIPATRRVVFFPGSTLGNFDPPQADALLWRIARLVGPGGGLLLGVDLRKDPAIIEAAYNDRRGVTAAFNFNLLARINRELGGDFNPDTFRHHAFYNREHSRIEMHVVSLMDQFVHIDETTIAFRAGETIHTENSYKYDLGDLARFAACCGFKWKETWGDARRYFAVIDLMAVENC